MTYYKGIRMADSAAMKKLKAENKKLRDENKDLRRLYDHSRQQRYLVESKLENLASALRAVLESDDPK